MSAAPLLCPGIEGRSGRNTGPGDTCSSRGLMRGHVGCARGPRAGRISAGSVRGLWQVTPWRLHGCVGWAATGTASSGVDQTVSGPCGEEGTGRALRPARRSPSGVLPQWGAGAASTVQGEASAKHSEACELLVARLGAWSQPWQKCLCQRSCQVLRSRAVFSCRTPVCQRATTSPRLQVLRLPSGVPRTGPRCPGWTVPQDSSPFHE